MQLFMTFCFLGFFLRVILLFMQINLLIYERTPNGTQTDVSRLPVKHNNVSQ